MKKIGQYFLEGLLVLVPFVVTIWVIYMVFQRVDGLFSFNVPGFGVAATILLIFAVGFLTSNFLTRKLVTLADMFFSRLPLIKMIYSAIKDLLNAFVGDKKSFNKPVRVLLAPDSNLSALGFVTNDDLANLGIDESVAVYLPQSYNFAGNLIVVPKAQVMPLDADSGDVMAFIVSGGVSAQ